MTDLRSLDLAGLEELCTELGWDAYRARQLYAWVWQKRTRDFASMTNLSRDKRELLAGRFSIGTLTLAESLADEDGTRKFTFRLGDGARVETVYIPEDDRRTVCVSTQVGCSLGCDFCRTARIGFRRDLAWHEIAGQVLEVQDRVEDRVTNVVLMGMGEPLLNYEASIAAIRNINSDYGINIGARRITLSTAGIPDGIRAYARFPLQSKLAVSLNASDDETRSRLMPVNRRYPLAELLAAVREFTSLKGKRVTFEYVLIRGVNDRSRDVAQLGRLLHGIPCKVNLIPFNPFPGTDLQAPSDEEAERFARALFPLLPAVTIRRSRGRSILAACGQLAGTTS